MTNQTILETDSGRYFGTTQDFIFVNVPLNVRDFIVLNTIGQDRFVEILKDILVQHYPEHDLAGVNFESDVILVTLVDKHLPFFSNS